MYRDFDENLDKKFALEIGKEEHNRQTAIKRYCKNHKNTLASFRCPICMEPYCIKCEKIIAKNKLGQKKVICINCWRKFLLKTAFFFITIFMVIVFFYFMLK